MLAMTDVDIVTTISKLNVLFLIESESSKSFVLPNLIMNDLMSPGISFRLFTIQREKSSVQYNIRFSLRT